MIRSVLYPARKDGGRADSDGGEQKSTQEYTHDIVRKGKCSSRMRWKMKEAGVDGE